MRAKRIALIGSLALAIVAFAGCGKEAKDTEVKSGLSDSVVVDISKPTSVDTGKVRLTIADSVAADSAIFYFEKAVQTAKNTLLLYPESVAKKDLERGRPFAQRGNVSEAPYNAQIATYFFEEAVRDARNTLLLYPESVAKKDLERGRPFAQRGNDRELLRRYDELQRRLHSTRN